MSLGYNGKGYFDNPETGPATDAMYQAALDELITRVDRGYRDAILLEKTKDYKGAYAAYKFLLNLVPARDNVIYKNVAERIAELKTRHPDPSMK